MNNRGQSLVVFIILIPIIIIILGIVIDIGIMTVDKNKVTNTLKNSIRYCLKKECSEDKLRELISRNIKYDKMDINMDNNIKVTIEYHTDTIFKLFNNKAVYKITGSKDNERIKYKEG